MFDHMQKMLAELPNDMDGVATHPAADHLFQTNPKPALLGSQCADIFHHKIAKLLFLCKLAHSDIQMAVAFLST